MRQRSRGHSNGESDRIDVQLVPPRRWKADLRSTPDASTQATTLSKLREHPEAASSLPPQMIPALVAELASEQATLSALQNVLTARFLEAHAASHRDDSDDRLMTADELAAVLGVPKRWVQRRA